MYRKYLPVTVVIVLAIAVACIIITGKKGTLRVGIDDFVPSDIHQVDKIELSRNDARVVLERKNNQWLFNSAFPARPERLDFLLSGLSRLEMNSPVSKMNREAVTGLLKSEGTRIALYHGSRLITSFYAYYDSTFGNGTCLMRYPSGIPAVVTLVGYTAGNLMELFSTDLHKYREEALFGYSPADILVVSIDYPDAPEKSFKITRNADGQLILSGNGRPVSPATIDRQELSDYLNYFGKVNPVHPLQSVSGNITGQKPFVRLAVHVKTGMDTDLEAFLYRNLSSGKDAFDKNMYIAVTDHGTDTVLLHYTDTDPIFRQIGDFQKN